MGGIIGKKWFGRKGGRGDKDLGVWEFWMSGGGELER